MSSEGDSPFKVTHLLFPSFNVTVSINDHLHNYRLGPQAYIDVVESDEDIDPFNFAQLWKWFEEHLHEFLMDIVDDTGPIDPDSVRLIALDIRVLTGPEGIEDVLDCEDCLENYQIALKRSTVGYDEDDEDDDD